MLCVHGWVSGTVLLLSELLYAREKADLWLVFVISLIVGYLLHYVKGHILSIVIFWNAMYYLKLQWKSKIYKLGSCGTLIQLWIDDVVMSQWYYLGCLCCLLHTLDISTLFLVNANSTWRLMLICFMTVKPKPRCMHMPSCVSLFWLSWSKFCPFPGVNQVIAADVNW